MAGQLATWRLLLREDPRKPTVCPFSVPEPACSVPSLLVGLLGHLKACRHAVLRGRRAGAGAAVSTAEHVLRRDVCPASPARCACCALGAWQPVTTPLVLVWAARPSVLLAWGAGPASSTKSDVPYHTAARSTPPTETAKPHNMHSLALGRARGKRAHGSSGSVSTTRWRR